MRWIWRFLRKRPRLLAGLLAALLLVGVGLWVASPWITAGLRRSNAEAAAVAYAQGLYPDQKAHYAKCQGRDTDGNDYVSCTLRIVRQDDSEEFISLECASYLWFSFGETCRQMATLRPSTSAPALR